MGIFDDILPAEYWLGAQTCPQCGYRIAQTEEYEQKAAALRAIRYLFSPCWRAISYTRGIPLLSAVISTS